MFKDKIKEIFSKEYSFIGHKEDLILLLAFIIGSLLRLLSATDNLWLDEIWSVNLASLMQSCGDVFKIKHDNNHILNTLYLYYFGFGSSWLNYRLLSIIAGALAVPLIGYIGFKRGFLSGSIASFLAVFSFPLITYSSEARGYAPAMLFALMAYVAFQNYNKNRSPVILPIFWISSILGILSHLTFLYIFAGFFLSSIFRIKESLNKNINPFRELTFWYAVPVCFMALLYLFFVQGMMLGGGEAIDPGWGRLSILLSPAIGLNPWLAISRLLTMTIFIAVSVWIFTEERVSSPNWIFSAFTLVTVPLFVAIAPLAFFGARYLSLLLPFLYLIMALILTRITSFSRFGVIICLILISLFAFGNIRMIYSQLSTGRGNYLDAVKYITENTQAQRISMITDHEFRNSTVINFYKQFVPLSKDVDYISVNDILSKNKPAPEWLVMHHRFEPGYTPQISYRLGDKKYQLVKVYPSGNMLSGWSWFIYQKQ